MFFQIYLWERSKISPFLCQKNSIHVPKQVKFGIIILSCLIVIKLEYFTTVLIDFFGVSVLYFSFF